MKLLDHTFPTPAENLACDEALLELAEATPGLEVLRFWEPREHFVVLGHSNRAAVEANLPACESRGIPVLRRTSGGGAVLQGPGCLNYTLVLQLDPRPELHSVISTTEFVLTRNATALGRILNRRVEVRGTSDMTLDGHKFSGNAQRRKRRSVLFHGTFLLAFDLPLIGALLRHPSREPDYRQGRPHGEFVANLNAESRRLREALCNVWNACETAPQMDSEAIARLCREKYGRRGWNFKF